ncbi:MAG: hypothetical protein M1831_005255 [Alyxoria varia]|nr:MAG: hypothetical protein M1831_005255 [Alyxoria varia]
MQCLYFLQVAVHGSSGWAIGDPSTPEIYWLQFTPLATPNAERCHQRGAGYLHAPPKHIAWERPGIQRGGKEVQQVYRKGKVGYQFRPRNEEKKEYDTMNASQSRHVKRAWSGGNADATYTHVTRLFNIHTSANIHPSVISPRKVSQPSTNPTLSCLPAARAVKTISTTAVA